METHRRHLTLMPNMHHQQVQNLVFQLKKKLDDLIRDLGLTKFGAELLTSRLNEWNLLDDTVRELPTEIRSWSFLSILMLLKTFAIAKMWKACLALLE